MFFLPLHFSYTVFRPCFSDKLHHPEMARDWHEDFTKVTDSEPQMATWSHDIIIPAPHLAQCIWAAYVWPKWKQTGCCWCWVAQEARRSSVTDIEQKPLALWPKQIMCFFQANTDISLSSTSISLFLPVSTVCPSYPHCKRSTHPVC